MNDPQYTVFSTSRSEYQSKQFYHYFKAECAHFLQEITAATQKTVAHAALSSYTTLLLNRILVLFFLQAQGLLAHDQHYLSHGLVISQSCCGQDRFYRDWLLPLFALLYTGHTADMQPPGHFSKVPHLALPLFQSHDLETADADLLIPDGAFARLFAFLERYNWQLDSNTDPHGDKQSTHILAYIFEQHSDQKQTGTYYTQDDVTRYIASHTILPALLARVASAYPSFATATAAGWQQLQEQPNRYIAPFLRSTIPLPEENEHEYRQRMERYQDLYTRMHTGTLHHINDLTSENLDIQCFVYDLLQVTQDISFIACFYEQLLQLTILDPTCGSGAFLIASVQLLRPLYTICLRRLRTQPTCTDTQQSILPQNAARVSSQQAFIITTILERNLYGVDLQIETVELCILRLYLLLVGEIHDTTEVPPLNDIHIHIHTGNALTPLTTPTASTDDHRFSWTASFGDILAHGGFSVIVGNPPYLEYSKIKQDYVIAGYEKKSCGNIYAAIIERSLQLSHPEQSYLGLVVPISICSSARFEDLRHTLLTTAQALWFANFEIFPCRLFEGAYQRLSILVAQRQQSLSADHSQPQLYVTRIHRWYTAERAHLLHLLTYTGIPVSSMQHINPFPQIAIPKLASAHHKHLLHILHKHAQQNRLITLLHTGPTEHIVYYQEATNYWTKAVCHIPYYKKDGVTMPPPHGRILFFTHARVAHLIMALMNSSLFYLWFVTYSDGFHLSHSLVKSFPLPAELLQSDELYILALRLEEDIMRNARISTRNTHVVHANTPGIKHRIEIAAYYIRHSKKILDEIDHLLASIYGFSAEEEDFIIHYDHKHRISRNHSLHKQIPS